MILELNSSSVVGLLQITSPSYEIQLSKDPTENDTTHTCNVTMETTDGFSQRWEMTQYATKQFIIPNPE